MAALPIRALLQRLRQAVAPATDTAQDGQLLDAYVNRHDEGAFAELLRRHGPFVLGVCRSVLRDPHRAEDAFQATFLILVRKAGSLTCEATLAGWLYRVARNAALQARATVARRRETTGVPDMPSPPTDPSGDVPAWSEAASVLGEEVQKLPERLRQVVLLCSVEGRSREEAARLLGLTETIVKGRLQRGRERLRRRLERRGILVPTTVLATLLTAPAVPAALNVAAIQAVRAWASGQAVSGVFPLLSMECCTTCS